jgi:SAM-dependent methyltransferase
MQPELAVAADCRDAYLRARHREGRLLPDGMVATLPDVPRRHPLHGEWRLRAESSARLLAHLRAQRRPLTVVDAGCGNGWLAHRISEIDGVSVAGVDVNLPELEQARRVFGEHSRLRFVAHDIVEPPLPVASVDVVVLASVVQYIAEPAALIVRLLDSLQPGGEVHVIDSPVYDANGIAAARIRSDRHYAEIGVPEMAAAYHHHAWSAFRSLPMDVLHRPDGMASLLARGRLRRPRSPFPWLRFARQEAPR